MFNDLERDEDTSLGKKRCCDWLVFFVPCPATNQVFLAFDMQYVPLHILAFSCYVQYFCTVFFVKFCLMAVNEWSSQTHFQYPWFAHDNMVVKNQSIFLC